MRRWVLWGLIALSLTPLSSAQAAAGDPGGSFWDDDGNVHEAQIEAIAAAGITPGCGPDLYCPKNPVTRGEMAAFLVRAFSLPASPSDIFSDDDLSIFEGDINALFASGITAGCGPGRFCPDRSVTRGEMAAFLVRAMGLPAGPDRFLDIADSEFQADIEALAPAGITRGCSEAGDLFCPADLVLRDQMASFLARALVLDVLAVAARPSFTVTFTGDTLLHLPVNYAAARYGDISGQAYDFRPMFARVAPLLQASDLALCHLEVPLHPDSINLSGYPTFQDPAEIADALVEAGYDGCSVASNHSIDKGATGVANTLAVLSDRGLGYDGMATSEADRLAKEMWQEHSLTRLISTSLSVTTRTSYNPLGKMETSTLSMDWGTFCPISCGVLRPPMA